MIASRTDLDFHILFRRRNFAYARQVADRYIIFFRYPDDCRRIARQRDIPVKVAVLLRPGTLDLAVDRLIRSGNFVQAGGEDGFHH